MFQEPYAKYYDLLNLNKPYKKEIDFVWNWAHKPKKILDVGCGTAVYWKYWPKDAEIFGVEKSPSMIALSPYKRKIFCADILNICEFLKSSFDLATALFDVIGYLPRNNWWSKLPLKNGGYFVFDAWDKRKIAKEGFRQTIRIIDNVVRVITPYYSGGNTVKLEIDVASSDIKIHESHEMFLYDCSDIEEMAGDEFDIVDVKTTSRWQTWYKLKKR